MRFLKEAFETDLKSAETIINKLKCNFIEEEGLSKEWANMLCNNCLDAISYFKGSGTFEVITAKITDFQVETNIDIKE